jgi:hypothetical protein
MVVMCTHANCITPGDKCEIDKQFQVDIPGLCWHRMCFNSDSISVCSRYSSGDICVIVIWNVGCCCLFTMYNEPCLNLCNISIYAQGSVYILPESYTVNSIYNLDIVSHCPDACVYVGNSKRVIHMRQ